MASSTTSTLVKKSWKSVKAPKHITLLGFFSLFQYFNLNLYYAMYRLCFISKRSDFERISKYLKLRNMFAMLQSDNELLVPEMQK